MYDTITTTDLLNRFTVGPVAVYLDTANSVTEAYATRDGITIVTTADWYEIPTCDVALPMWRVLA